MKTRVEIRRRRAHRVSLSGGVLTSRVYGFPFAPLQEALIPPARVSSIGNQQTTVFHFQHADRPAPIALNRTGFPVCLILG